jgi:hypothetical protein
MSKAQEDKQKSEIVKYNPPIVIPPQPSMIGSPVYCGNDSVNEYLRKKDEEHAKNRKVVL